MQSLLSMKRPRRDDENGWIRYVKSRRRSVPGSVGPIVRLMLPELRALVYDQLATQDRVALAQTCRIMHQELKPMLWIPMAWAASIERMHHPIARSATRAIIQSQFRALVPHLAKIPALGKRVSIRVAGTDWDLALKRPSAVRIVCYTTNTTRQELQLTFTVAIPSGELITAPTTGAIKQFFNSADPGTSVKRKK